MIAALDRGRPAAPTISPTAVPRVTYATLEPLSPVPRLFGALVRAWTRRDPTRFAAMGGTVGITAVGMFGEGQGGWGLLPLPCSVSLVVGSTAWKPAVVDGRIEPREILNLTVVFDHDVIDGAPAARFATRLIELIEGGHGLDALPVPFMIGEPAAAQPAPVR